MGWVSYLTVFGAGSLLTALVQIILSNRAISRRRQYDERKEAYIGLLEAWVRQESEGFKDTSFLDVGHWVLRSELVASASVFALLKKWKDTQPGSIVRIDTTDRLKSAMRDDLRSM